MLGRHIVSYLPSQVIPALTALAAITIYTHLMSPEAYGYYTLMINGHMLLNLVFFGWLYGVVLRLGPKAAREGYGAQLRTTTYGLFAVIALVLVLLTTLFMTLRPGLAIGWVIWFALGLGIARSLLTLHEAWHRGALHIQRYNLLECGQAVLSLIAGVALVYFVPLGARGAATGLLLGIVVMIMVDSGEYVNMARAHFERPILREAMRMGAPLIVSNLLLFILTSSDRFLIEYFDGAGAVGIYAAGYTLVDRIMQVLFMAISMASYSLTIHRLEHEGVEAARAQTYRNGIGVLALAMPACVGLIFCAPQLAAVVIGEDFRDGALRIMPLITLASFCGGLATHYFDHAFMFAKKPHLLLFTQGPGAVLNIILNLLFIPRFGAIGAAYATLASYLLLLTLSIVIGRRAFAIRFPFKPMLQVMGATAAMGLALALISLPLNLFGLMAMAAVGAGVYGAILLLVNLDGARVIARQAIDLVLGWRK